MTPRQPIGARRQAQRAHMGRHMRAVSQQRHGVIGKAARDLHDHEQGGDDGRPFGARLGAGMPAAQKDMVTSPDAVVVGTGGLIMMMAMIMGMTMVVPMGMPVRMIMKAVVVGHGVSLAQLVSFVIASEAKQSRNSAAGWIASSLRSSQ